MISAEQIERLIGTKTGPIPFDDVSLAKLAALVDNLKRQAPRPTASGS